MTLRAIEPEVYPWFEYKGDTFCLGLADGGAAWTSGQSASVLDRETGRRVIEGGLAEQAELSYTKLLAVLADAGLQPSDVAHITENVTRAGIGEYGLAAAVRERLFGRVPAVTTVVVDRLVRSAALIELELHAVPGAGRQLGADELVGTLSPTPVREAHDGTVHVPTILPLDDEGTVLGVGDASAQFARCLDLAVAALEQAGLGAEHIVAVHVYATAAGAGHFADFAQRRRARLGDDTVGGGVVVERLHLDGVAVAIDVTASRHPKRVVDPGWGATESGQPAIRVGDSLYCSAISTGSGTLEHQAVHVYDRLLELLAHEGLTPADLRSTIEFCVAELIGEYKVVAPVRASRLTPPWPASTGDLCTAFATPGAVLQTVAIANY